MCNGAYNIMKIRLDTTKLRDLIIQNCHFLTLGGLLKAKTEFFQVPGINSIDRETAPAVR